MTLTPDHYKMLHIDSAIADAVITHRGYRSLDTPAEVQARGFNKAQARTAPVLALPLWDVHGEQTSWQIRPAHPRILGGNVTKYETPKGGTLQLDVHPSVQPLLGDPQTPLWITEGVKKGDALVSAGAPCAIALIGVWGFKKGHMLPDWQHVALKGRTVYVVYDSDTATKKEVAHAQQDLLAWLKYRQALPACVEWPEDYQQQQHKVGVDDYLAAGHTLEDLLTLVPFIEFGSTTATAAKAPAKAPAAAADVDTLLTEDYNARELVKLYGPRLRYCYLWKCWLIWTGTHWQRDTSGQVMRWAKATVKSLGRLLEGAGDNDVVRYMQHIRQSLATVKLKAMMESAQSIEGIPVQPEDLDQHPWLLNCKNGTLDLCTGDLTKHDPANLLTKCLDVPYEKDATCEKWLTFLHQIMGGTTDADDPDMGDGGLEERHKIDDRATRLITFLQEAIGYSLTGSIREQCFFILYGTGSNGKSTFLSTLLALLGDYAQSTPSATLLATQAHHEHIPNDIARLRGARLVTAVEIGEGKRLNEELIKRLTGGEPLDARFLYGEWFSFLPEFKAFLACNHYPVIRGTDHAIWRRPRCLPFTVTIPDDQQDKDLPATLQGELPGILAWAVRGALAWINAKKWIVPEEVTLATKEMQDAMDMVEQFLAEVCVRNLPNLQARSADLYEAYKTWCRENEKEVMSQTNLGKQLGNKGCTPGKDALDARIWKGVGLRAKATKDTTEEAHASDLA